MGAKLLGRPNVSVIGMFVAGLTALVAVMTAQMLNQLSPESTGAIVATSFFVAGAVFIKPWQIGPKANIAPTLVMTLAINLVISLAMGFLAVAAELFFNARWGRPSSAMFQTSSVMCLAVLFAAPFLFGCILKMREGHHDGN